MQVNLDLSGYESEKETKTDLLPAGEYVSKIVEVEAKENKGKNGHFFAVLWEVVAGEFKGKRFMDHLNIVHTNQDTQRIALQRLKGILEKGGHKNASYLASTNEMLGITLEARLEVKTYGENNDKTSNDVKSYKAVGATSQGGTTVNVQAAAPVAPAAPAFAPPPAAPAAAAGAFPWGQPK